ncbi:hypothetical protein L7F22_018885 [Adiantum nelumboides]|nr:hypothetical protein [Adiantum nelumboides]
MGELIHKEAVSEKLLENNIVIATAVVDMYAKYGFLSKAQEVLEKLPRRTLVSWNALIGGYVQHEQSKEAIDCYERLQSEGLCPDIITYVCILKACGIIRAIDRGKEVHDEIICRGLLMESLELGNALVDMYVTFGMLPKAQQVFNELPNRVDVYSFCKALEP